MRSPSRLTNSIDQRRRTTLAVVTVLFALASGCASTGVSEGGGINLVSLEEEWRMRDDLHAQVQQEMRLVNDRSALDYINTVGRRIAAQTPLGNRRWDFYIVQDDRINAFNLPGGLVYVNSGLIEEAESLDQLAGVLAHEISHGAARHGTQLMTRAYGYNALAGILLGRDPGQAEQIVAQLVGTGVLAKYSRSAETEADRLGVQYVYQAGYDPRGMATFFRKLLSERQRRPSKVEQFFASHPVTESRIATVDAAVASLPRRSSLTRDTRTYQSFRSRFR